MAGLRVRRAGDGDRGAWDGFASESQGSVFHRWTWGTVVEESFGYKRTYLLAEDDDGIKGVLPLFKVKAFPVKSRLVSVPMSDLGGPLGDREAVLKLLEGVDQLLLDEDVPEVELRSSIAYEGYAPVKSYHTFVLGLGGGEEELWRKAGKKNRNLIRRAQDKGVTVREGSLDDIDAFYRLYLETMKGHGTPPYPRRFYGSMFRRLGREKGVRLFFADYQGEVAAADLFLDFAGTRYYYAGVSKPELRKLNPNQPLLYEALLDAQRSGLSRVDFGRTSTDQVSHFKKSWGGARVEYSYVRKNLRGDVKAGGDATKLASWWRWLVPLELTPLLGPPIRKRFGY